MSKNCCTYWTLYRLIKMYNKIINMECFNIFANLFGCKLLPLLTVIKCQADYLHKHKTVGMCLHPCLQFLLKHVLLSRLLLLCPQLLLPLFLVLIMPNWVSLSLGFLLLNLCIRCNCMQSLEYCLVASTLKQMFAEMSTQQMTSISEDIRRSEKQQRSETQATLQVRCYHSFSFVCSLGVHTIQSNILLLIDITVAELEDCHHGFSERAPQRSAQTECSSIPWSHFDGQHAGRGVCAGPGYS